MKKFTYRMQNILNLKSKIEEQQKNNYSQEQLKLRLEQDKLVHLKERKAAYEQNLTDSMQSSLNLRLMKQYEESIQIIKGYITEQMQVIKQQEKTVDLALQKMNFAMMERKTYERLKEKAFEQYRNECKEEEKKEIDELVSFQHVRKDS